MPRVVLAFDKFRGTATAEELVGAGRRAALAAGWQADAVPLADGGEGSLDVLGGANRTTTVTGPLGDPVEAPWRLEATDDGKVAFIEMAAASGLLLAGGAEGNDPLGADTTGTGELIAQAVEVGAETIYVLLGGSATTDGGFGAVRALPPSSKLRRVDLVVACDVETLFCDAARVFGPQKGASSAQVELLTRRLERLVQVYRDEFGVNVSEVPGAGAAGGLAGGLLAVGARIQSGFDVLAEHARLDERLEGADLVVTGEGKLDDESFNGKVVGGVAAWAARQGVPVTAVVGIATLAAEVARSHGVDVVSLTERYGSEAAIGQTIELVERTLADRLAGGGQAARGAAGSA